ncbi:GSU2403 family nucleotidyltransferase fold protein [Isoptericola sp. NPDC019693]|uniref:GSU2403 family nucleotidyltransferase fold protein n=1 Tax=Isoptericola sp. NPDC019693 TaxID=3364009 RepID=UPI0037925A3C
MNNAGDADLLVRARSALLDALEALEPHLDAVVVVGAQAVYMHTGRLDVALAEATKDSDVAVDPRVLPDDPRIENAMTAAGFFPDASGQPGAWVNRTGIPVDIMVPEDLAGAGGRRGARIPPHGNRSARRARGLEAAVVDRSRMPVTALDPEDDRRIEAHVAGPTALLVAKLHKIGERVAVPQRLNDKDAHDVYRILRAVETEDLRAGAARLLGDPLSREVTREAMAYLRTLFAESSEALGSTMAGRAEEGIGDPAFVAASASFLAADLVAALGSSN